MSDKQDNKNSNQHSEKARPVAPHAELWEGYGIEPWQATAYLLGELGAEDMSRIEAIVADDARLANELASLAKTLGQITDTLKADATENDGPDGQTQEKRLEAIYKRGFSEAADAEHNFQVPAAVGTNDWGGAAQTDAIEKSPEPEGISSSSGGTSRFTLRRWAVVAAIAACLLLVTGLSIAPLWQAKREFAKNLQEAPEQFAPPATSSQGVNEQLIEMKGLAASPLNAREISQPGRGTEAKDGLAASPAPFQPSGPSSGYGGEGGYGEVGSGEVGSGATASGQTARVASAMSDENGAAKGGYGGMGMGMGGMGGGYGGAGYGGGGYGGAGYGGAGYGGAGYGGEAGIGGPGGVSGGGMYGGGMGGYGSGSYAMPWQGDRFESIYENKFVEVQQEPLSTFSVDVDTASYTKCRQLLLEAGRLPPPGAVRIEEFVNYFDYEYRGPVGDTDPFAADLAVASCPWQSSHKLVRIALQAKQIDVSGRPDANIVFLLDVSGSMNAANKLPLVKESMRMLVRQLGANDRVAMVVYAGAAGCVLESTSGAEQAEILSALKRLQAGGSTNGGQGIQLAYDLARDNYIEGGINRVVLCTDGDFNVGITSTSDLIDLVAENAKSKIFLTVLGFGIGNTNDAMMEQISNRGNGVYGFVDNRREAHRQMVKQLAGNLMTVAKDVKVQVEFNPSRVQSYRLLGYENRMLETQDFDDDKKDAGEIGAGHRVTALYEVVPVGAAQATDASQLRYSQNKVATRADKGEAEDELGGELLAVKLRYKQPEGDRSKLLLFPLEDSDLEFEKADRDFRWAASMAEFGMLLRGSRYAGQASWSKLMEQAIAAAGVSPDATRQECLEMIRSSARLKGGDAGLRGGR